MQISIAATQSEVIEKLIDEINIAAQAALCDRKQNVFHVGISGGSLVDLLAQALPLVKSDLTRWRFYLCDERYVADNDTDSNLFAFQQKVLPLLPTLKDSQFLKANTSLPLVECALDYETRLLQNFDANKSDIPKIDLLLLGMGPDGHTCSLFPEHKALQVNDKLITFVDDSPKPPPKRITMSYKLINNAYRSIFTLTGESKAEMVKRVFVDRDKKYPASLVNSDKTILILDQAAAKCIPA